MIGSIQNTVLGRSIHRLSKQEGTGNFYAVSIVLFSVFLLLSILKIDSYTLDETVFHYPNLLNFYENGWRAMFNDQYSAANTPLPYLIVTVFAKIFSPSLLVARIVTALLSFATFIVIARILELLSVSRYYAFAILFFPYFFVNSFVFYAVNYGLFFLALALYQWLRNEKNPHNSNEFLTGTWFSLAILCQQFFLVIPFAIVAYRGVRWLVFDTGSQRRTFTQVFQSNILLLIPLLLPLSLFFAWGGLTHPNFESHSLAFYPSTVVAILFVTGFYFSPFIFLERKKITTVEAIASILLSAVTVYFFKPIFSDVQGPGLFTGLVFHVINIPAKVHPLFSELLMIILTSTGLLIFSRLIQSVSKKIEYALLSMLAFLSLAFSFNTQVGERHLAGLIMILFLLLLPRMKSIGIYYTFFMSIVGTGYFVYWYFFKFA